jgi:hypothetical protein
VCGEAVGRRDEQLRSWCLASDPGAVEQPVIEEITTDVWVPASASCVIAIGAGPGQRLEAVMTLPAYLPDH